MIIGIGTDIVQIYRIEQLLAKYGEVFKSRILSLSEIDLVSRLSPNKHAAFIAKRFAAKEAISKALGSGIGQSLQFKNIKIFNDNLGKPFATIHSTKIKDLGKFKIDLSISDDYPIAIAFAVVSIASVS
ncbi:holo-ACP synthase [Candidatus Trichorickettsia mobilis]|uniref:holo-ACP synthase n=1 Tax=Candidatus Trichorickettsia mobilis TaxID=1346319 RepID=UPI00292CD027|nr:holo-ACP synthase [Candidatus Trichorickettsia mobilis]